MKNSSGFQNILLAVLALFSAFAILRFTGVIKTPTIQNSIPIVSEPINDSIPPGPPGLPNSPTPPICDTCSNRYPPPEANGGMMIPTSQFMTATSLYQDTHNAINIRTCYAFVTKRAIDYMLNSNCNVNGLNCYFGLIKTPAGANKLTLMLTPAKSSRSAFNIVNPTYIVFESNTLCPDECGSNDTTGTAFCH